MRPENQASPQLRLFRLNGSGPRDPAIDTWFENHPTELSTLAHHWFEEIRDCADEVRELLLPN